MSTFLYPTATEPVFAWYYEPRVCALYRVQVVWLGTWHTTLVSETGTKMTFPNRGLISNELANLLVAENQVVVYNDFRR